MLSVTILNPRKNVVLLFHNFIKWKGGWCPAKQELCTLYWSCTQIQARKFLSDLMKENSTVQTSIILGKPMWISRHVFWEPKFCSSQCVHLSLEHTHQQWCQKSNKHDPSPNLPLFVGSQWCLVITLFLNNYGFKKLLGKEPDINWDQNVGTNSERLSWG